MGIQFIGENKCKWRFLNIKTLTNFKKLKKTNLVFETIPWMEESNLLHRLVFLGDNESLKEILSANKSEINSLYRGSTPLGLAAMLGKFDSFKILLCDQISRIT